MKVYVVNFITEDGSKLAFNRGYLTKKHARRAARRRLRMFLKELKQDDEEATKFYNLFVEKESRDDGMVRYTTVSGPDVGVYTKQITVENEKEDD